LRGITFAAVSLPSEAEYACRTARIVSNGSWRAATVTPLADCAGV
jgi:hypothetical protein